PRRSRTSAMATSRPSIRRSSICRWTSSTLRCTTTNTAGSSCSTGTPSRRSSPSASSTCIRIASSRSAGRRRGAARVCGGSCGREVRSADLLASYLQSPGVERKRYEPEPGRGNLVLRIEGSDPTAPSLHLMGHIDVVPVNPAGWRHDPFGGELIDGEVWGRGAIDMLDITASMAVAVRRLLHSGFRPKGTLVYSAMADEEARGTHGAEWLVDHAWDDVKTDYLLTEFGGMRVPIGSGRKLAVLSAEKGSQWTRLR